MMHRTRRATRAALLLLVSGALAAPLAPAAAAEAPPTAPSGLVATLGSGIVALLWADNSADEAGFEIEGCTPDVTGCAFAPLALVGPGATAYADQGATLGMAYRYRVRAVNDAGASAWSREALLPTGGMAASPVAVMTVSPTAGTAPLQVSVDGSGSYGIDFASIVDWSWSFGDGTTGSGPTAGHVFAAPGTYRVVLTVTDSRGHGQLTAQTVIVAPTPPSLVAPTGLTAVSPTRRVVALRWTAPAASSATSLAVQRCVGTSCTSFTTVATLAPSATAWRDTTVRSGVTYRYRLVVADPTGARLATAPVRIRAR